MRKLKITKPDETSRTLDADYVSVGEKGELYVSVKGDNGAPVVAVFAPGQWDSAVFGREVKS